MWITFALLLCIANTAAEARQQAGIAERFGLITSGDKPATLQYAAAARWLLANTDWGTLATSGAVTNNGDTWAAIIDHSDGINSDLQKANGTGIPIFCKCPLSSICDHAKGPAGPRQNQT